MSESNMPLLFPGNGYVTPEGKATWFGKNFSTLSYLLKTLNIVRHDCNLAEAGKYDGRAWSEGSLATLRALEECGIRFYVEGFENIDAANGPCVFIGNHMSTLETFVLPGFIQPRRPVTFVVKESLLKYPWFGPVLTARKPIVVSRDNPRKDLTTVLEEGTKCLAKGISVIVFPQSTRSATLDLSLFNSIGVKLAKKAGVPVVPFALRTDAWGVGRYIKDFGPVTCDIPVHFAFGAPLTVSGNGKAEHQAVVDFISSHLAEWGLPVLEKNR